MKKLTHGKFLGSVSFWFFEFIILFLVIYEGLDLFFGSKKIDSNIVTSILTAQGIIFATVWAAKASSNFAPNKEGKE